MEQTDTGECHCHSVFVAHIDHVVVTDRATRLCDILHAALVGTLNIITEREEGVGTESHILHLVEPCALLFFRDDNVIEVCNKYGMAMAFTGIRLFHH